MEMRRSLVWSIAPVAIVAAAFGCPLVSYAQTSRVSVSAGTHISSDSPNTPFAETFLAINPRDAKNLVATSIVGFNGALHCYVYASRDGGRTWRRAQTSTADNPLFSEDGGDPVVYFDSQGTAYFGELQRAFVVSRS